LLCCLSIPPATSPLSTLSLHDALPISPPGLAARAASSAVSTSLARPARTSYVRATSSTSCGSRRANTRPRGPLSSHGVRPCSSRSEEHTSELQSRENLVCRRLLEKKKQ